MHARQIALVRGCKQHLGQASFAFHAINTSAHVRSNKCVQFTVSAPIAVNRDDPLPHLSLLTVIIILIGYLPALSGTFNSLSKVLFIFPSQYLSAVGLAQILQFRRNVPPIL
jgi:hypothetical protein